MSLSKKQRQLLNKGTGRLLLVELGSCLLALILMATSFQYHFYLIPYGFALWAFGSFVTTLVLCWFRLSGYKGRHSTHTGTINTKRDGFDFLGNRTRLVKDVAPNDHGKHGTLDLLYFCGYTWAIGVTLHDQEQTTPTPENALNPQQIAFLDELTRANLLNNSFSLLLCGTIAFIFAGWQPLWSVLIFVFVAASLMTVVWNILQVRRQRYQRYHSVIKDTYTHHSDEPKLGKTDVKGLHAWSDLKPGEELTLHVIEKGSYVWVYDVEGKPFVGQSITNHTQERLKEFARDQVIGGTIIFALLILVMWALGSKALMVLSCATYVALLFNIFTPLICRMQFVGTYQIGLGKPTMSGKPTYFCGPTACPDYAENLDEAYLVTTVFCGHFSLAGFEPPVGQPPPTEETDDMDEDYRDFYHYWDEAPINRKKKQF